LALHKYGLNFDKQTKLFGSWKQSIILVVYYDYIYHKKNFFETRRNIVPWLQWMEQQNFKCFHSKPPRWDSYVVWALKMKQSRYDSVASSFLFMCSCTLKCLKGKKSWVRNVNLSFFLWYYILRLSYSFSLSGFVCDHLPASVKSISCTWP